MTVHDKALLTVLGCQMLFALLALPLALRKVGPNVVYGFRTPATLADRSVWYEVNARFGRVLLAGCALTALAAVGLFRTDVVSASGVVPISVVVLAAPVVVATLAGMARLRSRRGR